MVRPNSADNSEYDVIATVNETSWLIYYHAISVDTKDVGR